MQVINLATKNFLILWRNGFKNWLIYFLMFLIFLCGCSVYLMKMVYYKNLLNQLITETEHMESYLSRVFLDTNQFANYIGKQVADNNYKDKNKIAKLLQSLNINPHKVNDNISWSSFDWINHDGIMIANQQLGIISYKINMNHRTYIRGAKEAPWKLQISPPDYGIPSQRLIIPAGIGITNHKGTFLGVISLGFSIEELSRGLAMLITKSVKFIIYDSRTKYIYITSDNRLFHASRKLYINNLQHVDSFEKPLIINDNIYFYDKKSKLLHPLSILIGYNKNNFYLKLFLYLSLVISVFLLAGLTCLILTFYTFSKVMKVIHINEKAKKDFITQVNEKLSNSVIDIIQNCGSLSNLTYSFASSTKTKMNKLLEQIVNSAESLQMLSVNELNNSKVDLNIIITQALQIKHNDIFEKGIQIKAELDQSLPYIFVDSLSIKQAIICIIARIVEYSSRDMPNIITIQTYSVKENNDAQIYLLFTDTSFGFSDDDIFSIKNSLEINNKYNPDNLEFRYITKLIELNKGKCTVEHTLTKGNIIRIQFPINIISQEALSNIIILPFNKLKS